MIDPALRKKLEARIARAKTRLVLDHTFFGRLALSIPHVLREGVGTACTNGHQVLYDPVFLEKLSDDNILFLVAHEVMHPALDHMLRRGDRDPERWNIAADCVINKTLIDEGIGDFVEGGVNDPALFEAGQGYTEAIYNLMPEGDGGYKCGGIGVDIRTDNEGAGEGEDEGEGSSLEQASATWRIRVAQAAQAARMAGSLSGELERLVGMVLNPKVPWQDVLERFVIKAKTEERSFTRPNRRFVQQGMYMPSSSGEQMGEFVVFVDCSGSVYDVIDEFAAEIMAIHRDLKPKKMHVIYFDSSVSHHDTFLPDDTVSITSHGGGGTAFSPLFSFIDDNEIDPVCAVVLTDLQCGDFGPEPGYPVLWVSNDSDFAPWGEVVMM